KISKFLPILVLVMDIIII
ncbi:TPA: SHP2/SHP3 family peptide pheromone, partial [Streptococcus pneumoniae]|nr:SHP2/SHP3 family peptide pheromone [Streptococcus pneumoniae ATCC 700669]HET0500604.1 SHP2/SHP3 family peptide pheromone [Streptococcus pneumoniae]HET0504694.1 SHP2/SHP3 family peptide pheromone [Streptococcus pneumoniae]HET0506681.1 SHP2/SHP3 family peptide pheromone [Streptococcus pneumoniae]HET0508689.1 SHP2/SHP3 family peptide pheromone [Streptococcus pneumoniae]